MEVLKTFTTRWKKLDAILAAIVGALNLRTPQKGNGILLTESPSGVIIAIDPQLMTQADKTDGGTGTGTGGPTDGQWMTVNVVDDNCNKTTIQVWGKTG